MCLPFLLRTFLENLRRWSGNPSIYYNKWSGVLEKKQRLYFLKQVKVVLVVLIALFPYLQDYISFSFKAHIRLEITRLRPGGGDQH